MNAWHKKGALFKGATLLTFRDRERIVEVAGKQLTGKKIPAIQTPVNKPAVTLTLLHARVVACGSPGWKASDTNRYRNPWLRCPLAPMAHDIAVRPLRSLVPGWSQFGETQRVLAASFQDGSDSQESLSTTMMQVMGRKVGLLWPKTRIRSRK
jgi:hypothetical protein